MPLTSLLHRKALFFIVLLIGSIASFSQTSSEDVKKQALKLFEDEEFTQAYKLYSQLVSNYPKDPEYNYRLGVCMIYSEPDKKKCISYLKFANSKPEEVPKEAKFYLGRAYHINYLFDEAINLYNAYKKVGSASQQKKLQVDRELKACVYGKRLLSNLSDLVIQSKKQLNEADYFRSYDLKDIGGKLLAKPEEFKTSIDKKKKDKSIVYLPATGSRVYFSSYGEGDNRDIYYATKLPNGTFSPPQKVTGINSDQDEDYPFLHPNGTTMYFASRGFNGMGGYDIFKSTYIEATDSWSQPVNLEFPINSPDDDYLYVTDSLERTAFFSTGRQSLPGKIDVLKISTERKPIDILALKGTVVKESADQSLKSKITVKNMDNGNIVGIFDAQDNGDYLMDLPNGANLLYTVETPGLKTQSERVGLPMVSTSRPLKQTISYDKGILKIINYFDETSTDDSYLQYLKIIEKKAKLDVNLGENKLNPTLVSSIPGDVKNNGANNNSTNKTDSSATQANTSITTNTTTKNNTGLDNKQLSDIAKKESEDLALEGTQLQQDANDAFEVGTRKKNESDKKLKEADEALKNAETISGEQEKKDAVEKAIILKKDAESDAVAATKILDYSNTLKEDAAIKIKEAELTKQYSEELSKTINNKNNNKETVDKLDNIQKQLDNLSAYKNKSDNVYSGIKNEVEEKEKEVAVSEKKSEDIKTNIQEIKEAITANEADLIKAKRKEKEAIQTKITELKNEQSEKEKQYDVSLEETKKLKEELAGLSKGLDLANKVKTETIAAIVANTITATNPNTSAITSNSNTGITSSEKVSNKTLSEKYKDKIIVTDNTSKESIEQSSTELKNYNAEIDAALTQNKTDLAKTTNPTKKQQLANEIKLLETAKKQNQQKIAANTKKVDEINKNLATTTKTELTPVVSSNSNDAINKLDNLNSKLNINDNANFDYNGYQNAEAQKLKIDADAKINESVAQQKKLKDIISSTKEQLKNNPAGQASTVTPQQLYKEAEELNFKAFEIKSEANTKDGAEKDALRAEAKAIEAKANEKSLQAAEITKQDNKNIFDTNSENLNLLISANTANEADLTDAKKFSDEAQTAFKQAATIREEANSMPNIGAKLGNLSNAEEKETEAIAKQKQAIDLLKSGSPGITLKQPVTSSNASAAANNGGSNLNDQLATVNNGVTELLNSKVNAYEKLYEANKLELDQLTNDFKNNQSTIDKTPALKTDFISANNKITAAQNLKQDANTSTDNNKKINDLIEATKKQIAALNQFNALNKKLSANVAVNTARTNTENNNTNPANNNANNNATNVTTNSNPENNSVTSNTVSNENTNANNTNTTSASVNNNSTNSNPENNSVTSNTVSNTNANPYTENVTANTATGVTTQTVDIKELATKDTSAADVVTLFESKKITLSNPQANALIKQSLTELKNIENENEALNEKIKNAGSQGTSPESAFELKTKSDNLLIEAEELSVKAFDLKTLANSKTGTEKDSLMTLSKNLDDQSQSKKLEAVNLTQRSNELSYKTNNDAIKELLEKLKAEDPDLASQLSEKTSEVTGLKTKSQQLRDEANAQPNANAKIGAMMNAEEKEMELIQKQNEILTELKKRYPDYVVKENTETAGAIPADLKLKQAQLAEKQNGQLTNLTNAFSLEYETSKNNIRPNLNNDQKTIKQNADDLNAESKRLLIQSVNEKNPNEKVKLLTLAAKSANKAIELLNTLPKTNNAVATNNAVNRNIPNNNTNTNRNNPADNNNNAANTNRNNRNNNTAINPRNNAPANNANTTGRGTLKVEGLEVTAGNAYSA
ncbi:MAG: hypothetical protein ACXVDC_06760, partial [Bacteroidia bacterium]